MKISECYCVHPVHLNGDVLNYINLAKVASMTLEGGMIAVKTSRKCIRIPLVNVACLVECDPEPKAGEDKGAAKAGK